MHNRLAVLIAFVVLLAAAALAGAWFDPRYRAATALTRELQGKLSAAEARLEAPDLAHGIAASRIETPPALELQADALVARGAAPSTAALRRQTHTHVDAISTATLEEHAAPIRGTSTVTAPASCPTGYEWRDQWNRFHLMAPDIRVPDSATFESDQHFKLTAIVLRQDSGDLRTEQITLQETTADGSRVLGTAQLLSADFHYAPDAPKAEPIWDPHLVAELGAVVRVSPAVGVSAAVGVGATLLQWHGVGLAAVGYSDFRSLAGSGAAAEVFYRPSVGGRALNLAVSAGVGLGLDLAAHPVVGVVFVVL